MPTTSLHHAHLLCSDLEATVRFWVAAFGAAIVHDAAHAGARNVFLRVGTGRLHLYEQSPRDTGRGAVHHLGVEVDDLAATLTRLRAAGATLGERRTLADLEYVMAGTPDGVLVEVFSPRPDAVPTELAGYFDLASRPEPCP